MKKTIRYFLTLLFAGLVFYFLGRSIVLNWQEIVAHGVHFNYFLLIAAGGLFVISSFVGVWIIGYLFTQSGHPIQFWKLNKIICLSQLAKYVPGSVWQYILRFRYLKDTVSDHSFFTVTVLENLVSFLAGFTVAAVVGFQDLSGPFKWLAFAFAVSSLVVILEPAIFYFFFNLAYHFIKKEKNQENIHLTRSVLVTAFLVAIFNWVIKGAGFYLAILSVINLPDGYLWHMVAVHAASVVAGYVLLIFPGGLGIREGAIVFFLRTTLGVEASVFVAVVARGWTTTSELLAAAIAYLPLGGKE